LGQVAFPPGIRQTQICPSECQMVKCDSSLQRTRFHWVQWRRVSHHISRQLALCIVISGLCAAAWPRKPISRSSRLTVFVLTLLPRGSLELASEYCNRGQTIVTRYVLQHSAIPFWSHSGLLLHCWAVVSPRRFHFTITILTVDRATFSRADIWRTDLLERWHPMTVTELFSKTILMPMFVYGDCVSVCQNLNTCHLWVWLK
jgi:hypothetical protein